MKLFSFVVLLIVPLCAFAAIQQALRPSLAPIRANAKKAYTAEMDRAANSDCLNAQTSVALNECYE